jgi:polyhydroxyalkanoate synthesis regulator phasin
VDPLQTLSQLAGYPAVADASNQALQIAQAVQQGQLNKQEAAQLLEDLKTQNQIAAGANALQEHLAFNDAMSGLILIISNI